MRRLRPGRLRQTQPTRGRRSPGWACLLAAIIAAPTITAPSIAVAQAPPDEPPAAATPRPALASLVPDDVGLCIEADRLAERAARFVDGPLGARLAHFPPVARWVGENGAQLGLAKAEFQRRLGASPAEVGSGIFGGRMLFAVWPPAAGAANGPALLLVEAPDRVLLEKVLLNVVAVQREAGKWKKTWTLDHAGRIHGRGLADVIADRCELGESRFGPDDRRHGVGRRRRWTASSWVTTRPASASRRPASMASRT